MILLKFASSVVSKDKLWWHLNVLIFSKLKLIFLITYDPRNRNVAYIELLGYNSSKNYILEL